MSAVDDKGYRNWLATPRRDVDFVQSYENELLVVFA